MKANPPPSPPPSTSAHDTPGTEACLRCQAAGCRPRCCCRSCNWCCCGERWSRSSARRLSQPSVLLSAREVCPDIGRRLVCSDPPPWARVAVATHHRQTPQWGAPYFCTGLLAFQRHLTRAFEPTGGSSLAAPGKRLSAKRWITATCDHFARSVFALCARLDITAW